MASTTSNRARSWTIDVNPSPETMFHFSSSPSEPGKFDFYRVNLANHACYPDPMLSQNCDIPSLAAPSTKRRWTPFADIVASDQTKSSLLPSSLSSNSTLRPKANSISTSESSVASNTNGTKNELIQPVASFSSLTDLVKNVIHKGHLDVPSNQIRRPASGTTLSTKDLNHLSPQSM